MSLTITTITKLGYALAQCKKTADDLEPWLDEHRGDLAVIVHEAGEIGGEKLAVLPEKVAFAMGDVIESLEDWLNDSGLELPKLDEDDEEEEGEDGQETDA